MFKLNARRLLSLILTICSAIGLVKTSSAQADLLESKASRTVKTFATTPIDAPRNIEGLTADDSGNIYAASFELTQFTGAPLENDNDAKPDRPPFPPRKRRHDGSPVPPFAFNYIYVFDSYGHISNSTPMPSGVVPLGLWAVRDDLYVNDVINGDVLRYKLPLTTLSLPVQVYHICGGFKQSFPGGDPSTFCALNSNYKGPDGRIYLADNGAGASVAPPGFPTGRIFVLDPVTGASSLFFDPTGNELDVVPNGFPAFGVNGIAFDRHGKALYMDNMSDGGIYKLTLNNCESACTPGAFDVFVPPNNGVIVGPDNMDFDNNGTLWVASGQNMSVVGIDPKGHIIARVGSFQGLTPDGIPKGLCQPSGIVFSKGRIFVGNEANSNLLPPNVPTDLSQLEATTIAVFSPSNGKHAGADGDESAGDE